jgi:hypothetical protein
MFDDWESKCEVMVDKLLTEDDDDDPGTDMEDAEDQNNYKDDTRGEGGPEKGLLEDMVQLCLDKLKHQKDGRIRKSELGGMLRYKIGRTYQRGWLKHVVQDMQHKGLVHASVSDVFRVHTRVPKWCHFSQECKYLRNVENNPMHFKLFLHLCPRDNECPFLKEHSQGHPLTRQALQHFQCWKHTCPRGPGCTFQGNCSLSREHVLVFTHKVTIL